MKILIDFRIENPPLHKLYVIWAQEDLAIINEAIEKISAVSRVDMSILAGTIYQYRSELIKTNAAYQEACWRIQANDLLIEEDKETE